MARTLLRPTGFVDSPFGHDGKVARLAGGMNWFALVELISVDGSARTSTELVAVDNVENRFDDDMAAQWAALTAPRAPLQCGITEGARTRGSAPPDGSGQAAAP